MKRNYYCTKTRFLGFTLLGLITSLSVMAQTVSVTLTRGDQSALLQSQPSVPFADGPTSGATVTIDEQSTFQTIDGLGFALTQGSAQVISSLNASLQNSLLNELFNPTSGNAISVIRISIAASDLSNSVYFYNDTPGDVAMSNFSLEGPDTQYLIPIIKKIQAINPDIKVLATPWSAPPWMKTNNDSRGGSLQPRYYAAYARYFVRYLEEMDQAGIAIWAVTPQNEPENPFNQPSMEMNASEQLDFINNHLGPAIARSPFSPKIIAFDHNCDNTSYPITVLNNSAYAEGAAFHLYAGDISAMSTVRDQTGKNVYFTEQFTSSNGQFDGDFGWHMENVVIGSLRNWSKTVIEWNLAADPNSNPRTEGGCTECLGAITVNNSNTISRNVSYYIISQLSTFVDPGAVRLESTSEGILNVAVRNPDGEKVLLVYNRNSPDQNVSVNWGDKSFSYNVPGRSAVTFTWEGDTGTTPPNPDPEPDPSPSLAGVYAVQSVLSGKVLDVADVSTASGANVQQWTDFSADNQRWEVAKQCDGTYTLTARHSGLRLAVANNSNADGANVIQVSPSNSAYQRWKLEDAGNGSYRIINSGSNKALDVQDRSLNDGGNIQQWETFGDINQQWKLLPESSADAKETKRSKKDVKKGIKLRMYPNPVTDHTLTVDIGRDPSTTTELTISDASCRALFTQILSDRRSTIQLPTSLNPGVYLVSVSDGQQRTTKRIIAR